MTTLSGYISSAPNLTQFATALSQSNLLNGLNTGGPYTIFAPTDSAFASYPQGTSLNLSQLQYDIVPGTYPPSVLQSMNSQTLTTLNGMSIPISVTPAGQVMVGNVLLTDMNPYVDSYGNVVYRMNSILLPAGDPPGTYVVAPGKYRAVPSGYSGWTLFWVFVIIILVLLLLAWLATRGRQQEVVVSKPLGPYRMPSSVFTGAPSFLGESLYNPSF